MSPERVGYLLWDAFLVSWLVAALWSSRASARIGWRGEALHWLLFGAGCFLLFVLPRQGPGGATPPLSPLTAAWWSAPDGVGWVQVGVILAGFAFSWWARLHLGRLWSGSITRKEGHRVVDTGPYRLVRHPIYTGLLLSAAAMAGFRTSASAFCGLALLIVSFWLKARQEEGFLRRELGAAAYDAYSRRTPMLIPFRRS